MAYDLMKCRSRAEVFALLRKIYLNPSEGKRAILWLPNKDRIEVIAGRHKISACYISGISPNNVQEIPNDILSSAIWYAIRLKKKYS